MSRAYASTNEAHKAGVPFRGDGQMPNGLRPDHDNVLPFGGVPPAATAGDCVRDR
jgi:hypothetical protein